MGRRRKGEAVSGWICLDKPYDLTSTQAVSRVRRIFNAQKAGHAGTLDPLATGVLPIALGEATKTVAFMVDADKSYRFTIAWGTSTTTLDREGEVTGRSDVRPTPDQVKAVLHEFEGEVMQVPPAYSAIKVDGERAYDLARAGEAVELSARPVLIHGLAVGEAPDADHVEIHMDCGKGAYVRAVVRDLAARLGAEAHVSELRRTRVGPFTEASAIGLDLLEDLGHKARQSEALLPVETALDDIPALAVTDEDAFRLKQGRSIVLVPRQVESLRAGLAPGSRTVSAMCGGVMVALCEMRAGRLEPSRVFHLD
ncbi:tRNA pseudouridine(55) synthase TruB [Phenylobacterium sp.]|uniref:tRNA pseudouridine(55) synthase TruB n=1 Tax=Phenylobacterium sp. TaxID=1871053 RepID=UPI0017DDCDF5|nr:tRNA pseudouridine(55) synthase TruB [Phenylobacterium sp.]MBA4794690.1 tRNA pseudouridine(55) synthase TruB [Phenylobacterium sp.]MBC7167874.1 tRNA pseudouridine(55) synthase TruB [Phenylobacterium sp.]